MRAILVVAVLLAGCLGGPMDRVCGPTYPGASLRFPWDANVSKLRADLTALGWDVYAVEEPFSATDFVGVRIERGSVKGGGGLASGGADPVTFSLGLRANPPATTADEARAQLASYMDDLQRSLGGVVTYTGEGHECR